LTIGTDFSVKEQSITYLDIVFRKRIYPPYYKTTVKKDVNFVIQKWQNRSEENSRKDFTEKILLHLEYLKRRYPKLQLQSLFPINASRLNNLDGDLDVALKSFDSFIEDERNNIAKNQKRYLAFLKKKHCQSCQLGINRLLTLHHVIPLTEGGDNRLLSLLCPTCHRLVHTLINFRSKESEGIQQFFDWWEYQDDISDWWKEIGKNINAIVDVYYANLKFTNYEDFLINHIKPKVQEMPFLIFAP
jgi:5-methylcytosine-specific restriction endonuclease McrA